MLPRQADLGDPAALADEGADPEAELRARLILYRAHRDAGLRLADEALRRIGLFRREAGAARAAGLAGARPLDAPPIDPVAPRAGGRPPGRDRATAGAAARDRGPHDHARRAGLDHPRRAPTGPVRGAPGAAARRPRSRRHRDHVPGHARAGEAPRDRGRAGRAVGSDRRASHDGRGARRRRPPAGRRRRCRSTNRWSRSRDRRGRAPPVRRDAATPAPTSRRRRRSS